MRLLLAPLAACDAGLPESSTFEATVTGDVTLRMNGAAGVETDSPIREVALAIEMVDGGFGVRGVLIEDADGDVDGRGTYALGDGIGLTYFDTEEGGAVRLVAESGTLRVTRFSRERVTGTYSADLRSASGEASARVVGTFDALANESTIY